MIKEVLVNARTMDQYEKMETCIKEERDYWEQFKKAASEINTYYENKTAQHIITNVLKDGLVINEVKFE